jgi:hypothetical protein
MILICAFSSNLGGNQRRIISNYTTKHTPKKRASNQNALYRLTNYKQQLITDAALDGAKEEEEEEEEEFNNKYNKTRSWKSVSVVGFFLV